MTLVPIQIALSGVPATISRGQEFRSAYFIRAARS